MTRFLSFFVTDIVVVKERTSLLCHQMEIKVGRNSRFVEFRRVNQGFIQSRVRYSFNWNGVERLAWK